MMNNEDEQSKWQSKADLIFGTLPNNNTATPNFTLNLNQHQTTTPKVTTSIWPSHLVPNVSAAQAQTRKRLEAMEAIADKRKQQLFDSYDETDRIEREQENNKQKKVVICVKRKREEDPVEELYIEKSENPARKRARTTVDSLSDRLGEVQVKDAPLTRFVFVESSSNKNDKVVTENIKRKGLKDAVTNLHQTAKNRKIQKFKENVKQIRLLKVQEKRESGDVRVVQVDLEVDKANEEKQAEQVPDELKNYAHLLKNSLSHEEYKNLMKPEEYVYDYYYMDDTYDNENNEQVNNKVVVQIDRYNQDMIFYDSEYHDGNMSEDDLDSQDSNVSDHPHNDYPDEDYDEEEYIHEDGFYNDPNRTKTVRLDLYDEEFTGDEELNLQAPDPDSAYEHIINKYKRYDQSAYRTSSSMFDDGDEEEDYDEDEEEYDDYYDEQ
jgi:hypothetical protein